LKGIIEKKGKESGVREGKGRDSRPGQGEKGDSLRRSTVFGPASEASGVSSKKVKVKQTHLANRRRVMSEEKFWDREKRQKSERRMLTRLGESNTKRGAMIRNLDPEHKVLSKGKVDIPPRAGPEGRQRN